MIRPSITPLRLYKAAVPITKYRIIHSQNIPAMSSATTFYDFDPLDKKGDPFPLSSLKGKVVLVVNTASKCGFTPQFKSLETLYTSLSTAHPDKFTIIGFPCNQFGSQDPGSNDEIQTFCSVNYGVTFPVLAKVDVNGDKAAPLWKWLEAEKPGLLGLKRVKWNFEKFLIGADGKVVERWSSVTKPESLKGVIEKEIAKIKKEEAPAADAPAAAPAEAPKEGGAPQL
ncbi:peroxiredoxin hyr1 [Emmonsiellopsis sp. PD_5]|nr:peroxiredoxin hyr1 [Emmonsiellopsis sp. PD_5]